jgi:predicted O-methyltransferase YrrM
MAIPGVLSSWGGPLNGQRCRQQIVRELARAIGFDQVIETGTFRGASTEFFGHVTGAPVLTVESSRRHYEFARRRFAGLPDVAVMHGDSRSFLRSESGRSTAGNTLFYLDAHWHEDLPLGDELSIIRASWERAVVIVDDFEVPGDPGYAYDDYGPGKKLTAAYLPPLAGWGVFYPSASSTAETGARRGCVVLVSPALRGQVEPLESLRSAAAG